MAEPGWGTFQYRSTVIHVRAPIPVLCNAADEQFWGERFWDLIGPLAFVSHGQE
jgi:hypothetical protein